jgi:hypothetical protein
MKKLFTSSIALLFCVALHAQNWKIISLDKGRYYKDRFSTGFSGASNLIHSSNRLITLQADSLGINSNGDSVLYSNAYFSPNQFDFCKIVKKGFYIGDSIIQFNNALYLMQNGDSVCLKTDAHINDVWHFKMDTNKYISAKCVFEDYTTIQGITDSFKIFQKFETTSKGSSVVLQNLDSIVLSKENGLLELNGVLSSDIAMLENINFHIDSIKYPLVLQKIENREFKFDAFKRYKPGNYWQYQAVNFAERIVMDSVISTVPFAGGLIAYIKRKGNVPVKQELIVINGGGSYGGGSVNGISVNQNIETRYIDTVIMDTVFNKTIVNYNDLPKNRIKQSMPFLGFERHFTITNHHYNFYCDSLMLIRIETINQSLVYDSSKNCHMVLMPVKPIPTITELLQSGTTLLSDFGPVTNITDAGDNSSITYIKMGNCTIGELMPIYPQSISAISTLPISISPNPCNEKAIIFNKDNHKIDIEVFNAFGQKVNVEFRNNEINTALLPNGIYFLKAFSNKGIFQTKLQVIH